jgi:hypothetical protein
MSRRSDFKFSEVPQADIPRSVFDRSHGYKTTFNASYLVPLRGQERGINDPVRWTAAHQLVYLI